MDGERARARREREKLVIKEVPARHRGEELQQLGDVVNTSPLSAFTHAHFSRTILPMCTVLQRAQTLVRKRLTLRFLHHFNSQFARRQTVCACLRVTVRVRVRVCVWVWGGGCYCLVIKLAVAGRMRAHTRTYTRSCVRLERLLLAAAGTEATTLALINFTLRRVITPVITAPVCPAETAASWTPAAGACKGVWGRSRRGHRANVPSAKEPQT